MISLTLLRHAKSDWTDPVQRDFDRPLNAKGHRAARAMGAWLAREGLHFDAAVASPAVRVIETLESVVAGFGQPIEPAWDQRIYLASAATLLDVVREAGGSAARLLLVGHNPGLEELLLTLAAEPSALRDEAEDKYPTATLAQIDFDAEAWADIAPGQGRLVRFVRPRDLDPALGPDTR